MHYSLFLVYSELEFIKIQQMSFYKIIVFGELSFFYSFFSSFILSLKQKVREWEYSS